MDEKDMDEPASNVVESPMDTEMYREESVTSEGKDENNDNNQESGRIVEKRMKYRERLSQRKKKRKIDPTVILIPESFDGDDLELIVNNKPCEKYFHYFPLTCGLVIRLRSGLNRLYRKSEYRIRRHVPDQPDQLFHMVSYMTKDFEKLDRDWSDHQKLWIVADDLAGKGRNISNDLFCELLYHPLYALHPETNYLQFHEKLMNKIHEEHTSLQRPEGAFDLPEHEIETLKSLSNLTRTKCPKCYAFRQLYCGPCGIPMETAIPFLPLKIHLPFEILLLLHYQESLIKCTGIHASVLCEENTVNYWHWQKPTEEWQKVVESLDAENDILLFPYPNSISADEFDWYRQQDEEHSLPAADVDETEKGTSSSSLPLNDRKRYRLVVLEASWGYGKTMAQQILDHRKAKQLPPMKSIILQNILGEYWRFQSEGHSAVSTIEALAHTARVAIRKRPCHNNNNEEEKQQSEAEAEKTFHDLLILFRLQKYRVLQHVSKEGGKVPRAMEVTGDPKKGSWKLVSIIPEGQQEVNPLNPQDSKESDNPDETDEDDQDENEDEDKDEA
jgi:hypothetical protein